MTLLQPLVHLAAGDVSGTGTDVRVYRGIPYAAPPVGPLRWRPPQPAVPWSGVHDGSRFGLDPMQRPNASALRRSLAPGIGEDCLTLNVWAPAIAPAGGAPVMVWFDGGGYISGSASRERITGEAYARRGAVFVTVNYRVGVFGFLAHPALTAESPHHSSGNYGLLDAIAALQWIRRNIAAFGGDPARVTAMGGSAGAALTVTLLTSPLAAGLVDRVILASPSSLRPLCSLAEAEEAGRMVGDDLAAMRAMPAADLLALNAKIDAGPRSLLNLRRLRTIVDGWVIRQDEPEAYRNGDFAAVPAIVGTNANEGGAFTENADIETVAQWRAFVDRNFGTDAGEAWTYYGAASDGEVPRVHADAWSDAMFGSGVHVLLREIGRRQPKTYRYVFAHVGTHTSDPPKHGDDITYEFGTGDFEPRDRSVSDAMVAAFANFAATGDPNGPGAPPWAPYDVARDNYLTFGEPCTQGAGWRVEPAEFIERYYRRTR